MLLLRAAAILMITITAALAGATVAQAADRSLSQRFSANAPGDVEIIGNTLLTCSTAYNANCANARDGAAGVTPVGDYNNNAHMMGRINVDAGNTFTSSGATLDLPPGAQVLWAGIYFSADTSAGGGAGAAAAPTPANVTSFRLNAPGSHAGDDAAGYQSLVATVNSSTAQSSRYLGVRDITAEVQAGGDGEYIVADVQTATGTDRHAGWAIAIAYRDPTQPLRNLTVYDGWRTVTMTSGAISMNASGFVTPYAGAVDTTAGAVTFEGDLGSTGDYLELAGTRLSDALNPSTNFYNSTIERNGTRTTSKRPDYANQFGFDIDLVQANGILGNNTSSANLTTNSTGETIFLGALALATELLTSHITTTITTTDLDGGSARAGDVLEYEAHVVSDGEDDAQDVRFTYDLPADMEWVPGQMKITSGSGAGSFTDAASDDRASYDPMTRRVTIHLGSGANAVTGGVLTTGAQTRATFRVRVASTTTHGQAITSTASVHHSPVINVAALTHTSAPFTVTAWNGPDLATSVTPPAAAQQRGTTSTWTLGVSNVGTQPTTATAQTATHIFPSGVVPQTATGTGWSCSVTGQTVSCTRSDALAVGSSFPSISISAATQEAAAATAATSATIAGGGDVDAGNNGAIVATNVISRADLATTLVAPAGAISIDVGAQQAITLRVTNDGPSTAATAQGVWRSRAD